MSADRKGVLAVLDACEAYVDDAAQFPEQFKPGVVKRDQAQYREARAAIADLLDKVAARKRLRDEFRAWSKSNPDRPAPREFMQRFNNADDLVNAALASCEVAK